MNAPTTPGRMRPRRALYLRALRPLHRLLLRLFTTRCGRFDRIEIGSGVAQAQPGDEVRFRCATEEQLDDWWWEHKRISQHSVITWEVELWRLRRPD